MNYIDVLVIVLICFLLVCLFIINSIHKSAERHRIEKKLSKHRYACMERMIIHYTNLERKEFGLPELKYDVYLNKAARDYSRFMAKNHFFDHNGIDGSTPETRVRDAGGNCCGIGENICKFGRSKKQSYKAKAEYAVDIWMNSPGHCENILNPDYGYIGVGVSKDKSCWICTQDFRLK